MEEHDLIERWSCIYLVFVSYVSFLQIHGLSARYKMYKACFQRNRTTAVLAGRQRRCSDVATATAGGSRRTHAQLT